MTKNKIYGVILLVVIVVTACGQVAKLEPTVVPQPTVGTSPTVAAAVTGVPSPTTAPTNTPVPTATPVPIPITVDNAGNLTEAARWGKGKVLDLAYSPDGKILALATTIGLYLYNTADWSEARFIDTGVALGCLAYSPDGAMVAVGGDDGKIQFRQVSDGALVRTSEDIQVE